MSSRPPSAPPQLPGYEYEELLGSGGFADVFRYRQSRPQRRVAIKVLLSTVLDDSVRRQFDAEANVMAQMSTHPSIVTIHQAEVSDDHRPYLVMEYCPRPNYGVRFRKERITVAEALRTGVQIAGAVETAHRAGILHRDIKPANILVTDYNRPALTDFGISIATAKGHDVEDSQGMSIPWSPPEFFADPPRADVRSDVFSLAATVYSLLAGQTPFERKGQRNTASDLIHRISSEPLSPLERPDVPPELNRVLSLAMAKDPASRYDTALAFGRGLQQVEQALSLPVTQMDVLDERGGAAPAASEDDELDSHTRIRKVSTLDPETGAGAPSRPSLDRFAGVAPALGSTPGAAPGGGSSSPSSGESTQLRPANAPYSSLSAPSPLAPSEQRAADETPARKTPLWPYVLLASVLVILLGVGSTFAVRILFSEPEEELATTDPNAPVTQDLSLQPPEEVTITLISPEEGAGNPGVVQVSWTNPPGYADGQIFEARWKDLPENYEQFETPRYAYVGTTVTMFLPPGHEDPCVLVSTVDQDTGMKSAEREACLGQG